MNEAIRVRVHAEDALSHGGVVAALADWPEVRVVGDDEDAGVALVVADEIDDSTLRLLRAAQRGGCSRAVLVVTRIDDRGLLAVVEAGVAGVVRRDEASPAAIVGALRTAAAGEGVLPADLVGRLLDQVGKLQRHVLAPRGLTATGLTQREISVLRLVAEGCDTGEIAHRLSYSERTIKNVIHDVTSRLHLRNRSQAVAWALREGLI